MNTFVSYIGPCFARIPRQQNDNMQDLLMQFAFNRCNTVVRETVRNKTVRSNTVYCNPANTNTVNCNTVK